MGCFSVVHAANFPAVHPQFGIYLDLTNGRGQVALKVQIIDCDEAREPIFVAESPFDFADVRMIAELDFMVGGISFPKPGEYRLQVFANSEFVIERRILVNQIGVNNEQ